jgi:hypothetical protein
MENSFQTGTHGDGLPESGEDVQRLRSCGDIGVEPGAELLLLELRYPDTLATHIEVREVD